MARPDALLVCSFGGPEGPDEVGPFLDNVLRGRDVPEARKRAVAGQYLRFGGISPLPGINRALVAAVRRELAGRGRPLPVYLGNRNWHPLLAETVAAMRDDGVRDAAVFVTSAFGSYSGCRQYREDLAGAAAAVPGAPALRKLRLFYDHPRFVEAAAAGLASTLAGAGPDPLVLFSAHSVPLSMAEGAPYARQLRVAAGLVAARCGVRRWEQVYQSRSGPPTQPWLGPDICDRLRGLPAGAEVVACPIGFVADHMEVVYDLDTAAAAAAAERGIRWHRAPTAGAHPSFVALVADLVAELDDPGGGRPALGADGPWPDACPGGCCPPPPRRAAAEEAGTAAAGRDETAAGPRSRPPGSGRT